MRDSVRSYLRDHYTFERRRAISLSESGQDTATWADFAHRLGILSLADADNAPDPVDIMVIMEELGEALVIEPFLETVVTGAALLRASGGEVAQALLAGVIEGKVKLALAWAEAARRYAWQPQSTTAHRAGNMWRIDGVKSVVVAAPWATHLLVSAATANGASLFLVAPDTPGVTLKGLSDDRRPQGGRNHF